jgi:transcriptional regulator with XRE-family HTH domain
MPANTYGQKIKRIRLSRKIAARDVSRAMKKDVFWISRIESGAVQIEPEDVPVLANLLRCTLDEMFLSLKISR